MPKQRWTLIQPEWRYRVVSTMIPLAVIAGLRNRISLPIVAPQVHHDARWVPVPYTVLGREKGVEIYSEVTAANIFWIANMKGPSTSKRISNLKITANLAAVRSVPGRSIDVKLRFVHGDHRRTHIVGDYKR
ncbi:hypothetical protein ANN_09173 [Periplaneta americana]|uniref:Uncharacterized protein n=1 Tax=Periplaneta americana TaxID=6978 RepID=A0ABQ8TMD4_PERAM|nr:hypothetical protein ANN_09173 [Periplaneta americana]